MAMGLAVIEAARAAGEGQSLAQVSSVAQDILKRVKLYFIPATLDYLQKGGRIGGAAALLGSILHIVPILYVTGGRVELLEKARGMRSAEERLLNLIEIDCQKSGGVEQAVVHHVLCPEKGSEVALLLEKRFNVKAPIFPIGPVLGLHAGPGAFGVVYVTKN